MSAYYNEIDPHAAAWLRELIKDGLIAPGIVDERSIEDVVPNELIGYTQCHFFAGIGVWSYALRRAGWPDSRPIWTGSCPCQPFSAAGKGAGIDDERHLWPAFFHLVEQCRPVTIIGEQVASKDALAWLDIVQADLERAGYACGAVDTCAAGFGAPHIRQRLHWLADTDQHGRNQGRECIATTGNDGIIGDGAVIGLANSKQFRQRKGRHGDNAGDVRAEFGPDVENVRLADADRAISKFTTRKGSRPREEESARPLCESKRCSELSRPQPAGPTNGHWRDVDWLFCRDGKWRPTESRVEPLADGLADRLGYRSIAGRYSLDPLKEKAESRKMRLKGYGNAIVAEQAVEFIRAVMDIQRESL